MKIAYILIAFIAFFNFDQPIYGQSDRVKTFNRLDKMFQNYKYGKHKIILGPTPKDYILLDYFKEYFIDKTDKLGYENLGQETIIIFGTQYICVKQFTLVKYAPDPCEVDPFKVTSIEPLILFYNEIFPSFICGVSSNAPNQGGVFDNFFLNKSGSIGFRFTTRCKDRKVYYEISSPDGYFQYPLKGVFYSSVGKVEIFPDIPWNYEKLMCTKSRTQSSLHFRFYDDQGQEKSVTETVYYRSPNDCILGADLTKMGYSSDGFQNMRWMTVGYVNEESREIEEIMNEIVKSNPQIPAWGYAAGSGDVLFDQIEAIWKFLQAKDVKYASMTTTTDGFNPNLRSQYVRNVENSLNDKLANCIDGSVLIVSILRKWGFPTSLVLVPGHAFISFGIKEVEEVNNKTVEIMKEYHLETTLVGAKDSFGEKCSFIRAVAKAEIEAKVEYRGQLNYYNLNVYRPFVKPVPFHLCKYP
ncbi:MAG TPA: hypothetical protein PKB07_01810 [Flavilitoribacter sp.]|nr:hypothetical protein [Flavilitoribacter sp.]